MTAISDRNARINDAVQIGVLEMLISPEYGRAWIAELAEDRFGSEYDEDILDEIEDDLDREMVDMAKSVLANIIDDSVKSRYEDIVLDKEHQLLSH